MTPSSTRNWQRLPLLVLLAAQASAVSLKNFQGLDGLKVSTDCEAAYYTNLSQCIFEDFMGGKACSVKCKASIGEVAAKIQSKCAGVQANSDSLMYRGQKNQLVDVLCIDPDEAEKPKSASRSTTTTTTSTTFSTATRTPQPSGDQQSGGSPKFIVVEPTTSSKPSVPKPEATGGSTTATTNGAKSTTPPVTNGGGGDPFGGNSTPASSGGPRQIGFWGYGSLAISGIACVVIMA